MGEIADHIVGQMQDGKYPSSFARSKNVPARPVVNGSKKLSPEECLQLDKLLRTELEGLMDNRDIQIDCYEMIYEDFFGSDAPELTDEKDLLISAHLDAQWDKWQKKLIAMIRPQCPKDATQCTM